MIEQLTSAFDFYFGPVTQIFEAASQTVTSDPTGFATGFAVVLVLFRLVTGYYVSYMVFGVLDPIINLGNEARVVVASIAYTVALFLLGRWPTDLYESLQEQAMTVGAIYTQTFPDTAIGLDAYVWDIGVVSPRWMFALEVLTVAFVLDFLVFKKKGEVFNEERSIILLLTTVLVGLGAYVAAPFIFPTVPMVAFTAKVIETVAGLYVFTWAIAFLAVGLVKLLKAGPEPIFPVREAVEMPTRGERAIATVFVGFIFVTETAVWALLKIGGVLTYLAGGGWNAVYILTGGVQYEQEYCELEERDDGTVEEVCRTVTQWEHPWRNNE